MTRGRVVPIAICWLLAIPTGARADEVEDARKQAKALYQQGEEHLAAKRYDEAIRSYEKAYELAPAPGLLYNLAQAHRRKGDRQKAVVYYEKYLAADPNGKASAAARQNITELRAEIAEAEAKAKHKAAEEEAKRKAAEEEARRKTADEEAKRKAADEEAKRKAAEEAARPVEPTPAPVVTPDEPRPGRALRIAGWSLVGVGVVGVGLGVVFGLEAQSLSDELSQDRAEWSADLNQKVADGEAADRNMILGYTIGGAALVTGAVLLYLGYRAPAAERSTSAVTWHPVLAPDRAGLAVEARF